MRNRWHRHPQVERLEAMTLLSGASSAVSAVAAVVTTPPTTSHAIHLTGTAKGNYDVYTPNPDVGKDFTFSGSGAITPLGQVHLTGHIHSPGFIANGHSTGLLVLSNPKGSVTLQVTGPNQTGSTPVPDVFSFKITSASGKFKGDTGTGYIDLQLSPAKTTPTPVSSAAAPNLPVVHGTFTMTFLTVAPPSAG